MVRSLLLLLGLMPTLVLAQCPTAIDQFLDRFQSDESFRLGNTRFPLTYSEPDRDSKLYPDAPSRVRRIERSAAASMKMPLYPSVEDQRSLPLTRKISTQGLLSVVSFDKPESDAYSYRLHFQRTKTCWRLTKIQDVSI